MNRIINKYGAANTELAREYDRRVYQFVKAIIAEAHVLELTPDEMLHLQHVIATNVDVAFADDRIRTAIIMRKADREENRRVAPGEHHHSQGTGGAS